MVAVTQSSVQLPTDVDYVFRPAIGHVQVPKPGQNEPQCGWSDSPLYSSWLQRSLGLDTPWEQYGLYASTGIGLVAGYKYVSKAQALVKAAAMQDPGLRQDLLDRYRMAPQQLKYAQYWTRQFVLRGAVAAAGAPVLWLVWRMSSRKPNRNL
eukprot:jgi/Chrzof1/11367/Cz05g34070.t1